MSEEHIVCHAGRLICHHELNDLIWQALGYANIPFIKEPASLFRFDCKRSDGLILVPWKAGKLLGT